MLLRTAPAFVLLAGLTGCRMRDPEEPDPCPDSGTCCGQGLHPVTDFEHPTWVICVWDEDGGADAGACPADAATIAMDASADAP